MAKKYKPPLPDGVVDITGIFRGPSLVMTVLRLAFLSAITAVAAFGWLLLWLRPVREDEMGPRLAVFMVIAFGPLIVGFVWFFRRARQWERGVGQFITAEQFRAGHLTRPIPGLNAPAVEVLRRVAGFAAAVGPPVKVRETGARAAQARALQVGGIGGIAAAVVIGARGGGSSLVAAALCGIAIGSFIRAGHLLQPSVTTLLAVDRRRPVLFLRSFADDNARTSQMVRTPLGRIRLARRVEQGIAGALNMFGPLIAIGKPGEPAPAIGAARVQLSDDEWQPTVLAWMDRSQFIVMMAGATRWITWELHRVLEMRRAHHLFVVFPPQNNAARWRNVVDALSGTPWQSGVSGLDPKDLLLLRLHDDGRVGAILRRGRPLVQDYQLALALAIDEEFCRGTG